MQGIEFLTLLLFVDDTNITPVALEYGQLTKVPYDEADYFFEKEETIFPLQENTPMPERADFPLSFGAHDKGLWPAPIYFWNGFKNLVTSMLRTGGAGLAPLPISA